MTIPHYMLNMIKTLPLPRNHIYTNISPKYKYKSLNLLKNIVMCCSETKNGEHSMPPLIYIALSPEVHLFGRQGAESAIHWTDMWKTGCT